jgi:hypothetical protein
MYRSHGGRSISPMDRIPRLTKLIVNESYIQFFHISFFGLPPRLTSSFILSNTSLVIQGLDSRSNLDPRPSDMDWASIDANSLLNECSEKEIISGLVNRIAEPAEVVLVSGTEWRFG